MNVLIIIMVMWIIILSNFHNYKRYWLKFSQKYRADNLPTGEDYKNCAVNLKNGKGVAGVIISSAGLCFYSYDRKFKDLEPFLIPWNMVQSAKKKRVPFKYVLRVDIFAEDIGLLQVNLPNSAEKDFFKYWNKK